MKIHRLRHRHLQRFVLTLALGLLSALPGNCDAQQDRQLLSESVISYHFHTGPSAPRFLSQYVMTIKPGRVGALSYSFGPAGAGEGIKRTFQIAPPQYQTLLESLAGNGVLAQGWKMADSTAIGSDEESITIEEPARKTVFLSSSLDRESAARFRASVTAIRAVVPMAMWLQKDADQRTYQTHPSN